MKVLVLEDEQGILFLLQMALKHWGYEILGTDNGTEAWQILQQEDAPRLAILDWKVQGMGGVEICREVRKRTERPYIYVLLLTARAQKEDIVIGLEAGADDYLIKPFEPDELRVRLLAGCRILQLLERLIMTREALRFQPTHDPLTGLWSHTAIVEAIRAELARAKRQKASVGIVLADLDHFKEINYTYGYLAGDMVLRETARRMRSLVRIYDFVGRYGGEEFLVVLPGCDAASAMNQAERLRVSMSAQAVDTPEGMIPVTLSLGLAVTGEAENYKVESLLRAADTALARAKKGGHNRVELVLPT